MSMKLPPILLLMAINVALYSQTKPDSLTIEKSDLAIPESPIHGFLRTKKRIAVVVTEPVKGKHFRHSDIWMYEIESKTFYQFTWSPKSRQ